MSLAIFREFLSFSILGQRTKDVWIWQRAEHLSWVFTVESLAQNLSSKFKFNLDIILRGKCDIKMSGCAYYSQRYSQ